MNLSSAEVVALGTFVAGAILGTAASLLRDRLKVGQEIADLKARVSALERSNDSRG